MKKSGFTLAEILISLMILGVLAALTIPSLIQNTHKKEEVVKMKKALSVISQAIAMDKALTGEDLLQYTENEQILEMLKKRLNTTGAELVMGDIPAVQTQDGIIYSFWTFSGNYRGNIYTQSNLTMDELGSYVTDAGYTCDMAGTKNNPFGGTAYTFTCKDGICSFINGAEEIINAADPSKYHKGDDCTQYTSD